MVQGPTDSHLHLAVYLISHTPRQLVTFINAYHYQGME